MIVSVTSRGAATTSSSASGAGASAIGGGGPQERSASEKITVDRRSTTGDDSRGDLLGRQAFAAEVRRRPYRARAIAGACSRTENAVTNGRLTGTRSRR